MSERFGSGIHLDEQLDFSVDPSGDLQAERGLDELQKDLAFQMIVNLQEFIGQPPSNNISAKVIGVASSIAVSDSRVSSVDKDNSSVTFNRLRDEITINLIVRTVGGEQELVFNV